MNACADVRRTVGPKHTVLLAQAVIAPRGAGDGVGVRVGLAVVDAVAELVPLGVGDREGVPVGDGVGEGEPLFEGVGVPVSDLVAVTVWESEGVPERVCVAVLDVVTVDVEESEAPGDGVCVVVRVAEHDGAASRKGKGQDSGQGHASGAPAPAGQ